MASATFQSVESPMPGAPRAAWLIPVLLVAMALAAVAAAGWWGYQSQLEPDASAGASAVPTTSAPASPAPPVVTPPSAEAVKARPAATSALSWPLWEFRLRQPIPPRDPSLTPPRWRLVGSTLSGGKWAIIVLRQGKTDPEYFSVGQELPGGYRIAAISEEDVTLVQGKRTMVLSYIGSR